MAIGVFCHPDHMASKVVLVIKFSSLQEGEIQDEQLVVREQLAWKLHILFLPTSHWSEFSFAATPKECSL